MSKSQPGVRAALAALVLLVRELQGASRDQAGEIALLRAQMAALGAPAPVPDGFVCIKVAAHALGRCDEWLRQRCLRREFECMQVGGKNGRWYVAIGTLGKLQPESGGRVRP
jgi:hypothetical protein